MDGSAPGNCGVAATDHKRLNARFADHTISGIGEMADLASDAILHVGLTRPRRWSGTHEYVVGDSRPYLRRGGAYQRDDPWRAGEQWQAVAVERAAPKR